MGNRAFYKLVGPFVDAVTKEKIRFTRQASEARELVDPEQLEKDCFGGDLEFEYASFFPYLEIICILIDCCSNIRPSGLYSQKSVPNVEQLNWNDGQSTVIIEWDFPNGLSKAVRSRVIL